MQMPQNLRVLDLCAGTGCIGLAIAARVKDARVTLGEISPEAIRVAKKNIQDNHLTGRVSCIQLDVREVPPKFIGKYDLIVSNPPYITAAQMELLDSSVKDYEPRLALYGGLDGLDFYRAIVENYTPILKPGGYLCFEFGMGQESQVCSILMEHGYQLGRLVRDSGERARAVMAQKPNEEET
jgi:release factor glutamine methyltransferase